MLGGLTATAALGLGSQAQAQPATAITIGQVESEKTCTLYQEEAGTAAMAATPYAVAAVASWRTWLVRDCVDKFASLRNSLEAALAASGKLSVRPGAPYVLSARISEVGGGDGPIPPAATPRGGYSVASNDIFVNIDVALHDRRGRTVYGALITKHLETSAALTGAGYTYTSSRSGQALYTELQHEVALAVARKIGQHFAPLQVMRAYNRTVELNYGSPLLKLGSVVQVMPAGGGAPIRYVVTSASEGESSARVDGDGDVARVFPGSMAVIVEADDPAANGRRFDRAELP